MALKVGELYGELRLEDRKFQDSLGRAEGGFRGLVATATGYLSKISGLVTTLATGAVVKLGFELNASMEQAKIGFTTMLKSGQKAEKFLEDLQEFAAKTPFEFPELRSAAQRMVAFGFAAEDVIPTLRAVGDAVAATGGGQQAIDSIILSLGQMKTVGKASWEEIRQIAEWGVPALKYLAEEFGMTQKQVMEELSKGSIEAEKAINAIIKGINRDYGGMMKNAEKTWTGMVANIRDGAQRLIMEAFKPIFNWTRDNVLPEIQGLIERLEKGFKADGFRGAMMEIIPDGIEKKIKQVGDGISEIKALAEQGDWAEVGQRLGKGFRTAIANMGDVGGSLMDVLKQSLARIDWAAAGKASVSIAAGFVLGFVDGLLDPGVWFDIVTQYWDTILMLVLGIIFAPAKWISGIAKFLARIPIVGKMMAWLLLKIKEVGTRVVDPIINTALSWGKELINGFVKGLGLRGPTIWPKIKELVGRGIDRIKEFGSTIASRGGELMNRLGQAIAEKGPAQVVRGLQKIRDRMSSYLGSLAKSAWNWGSNLISTLISGINARIGALTAKVREVANKIKSFLGFSSPTEEGPGRFADRWAPNLMKMYAEGIEKGIPKVQSAALKVAKATQSIQGGLSPIGGQTITSQSIDRPPINVTIHGMTDPVMAANETIRQIDREAFLRGWW